MPKIWPTSSCSRTSKTPCRKIGDSRNRNIALRTRWATYGARRIRLITSEILGCARRGGRSDPGNRAIAAYRCLLYNSKTENTEMLGISADADFR